MQSCPGCGAEFRGYRIVGLAAANATETGWLEEKIPLAMLFCHECGQVTFSHPDHPAVQRLEKEPPVEAVAENVRTLNVDVAEVGDTALREKFEVGHPD